MKQHTMYDFHDSTDTLKFWTEKWAINNTFFVFHPILMKLGEIVVHMDNYNFTKFHQNQMKNKKSFINSPFFCSEFQSVSRIVKIIHSAFGKLLEMHLLLSKSFFPELDTTVIFTIPAACIGPRSLSVFSSDK